MRSPPKRPRRTVGKSLTLVNPRLLRVGMSTKLLCMTLTLKQARLIAEYLIDLNGRKAAICAG